jgi:Flp pilus assembly protein TadD
MSTKWSRTAIIVGAVVVVGVAAGALFLGQSRITVDYPLQGSVFPPDFAPPTFEWHDASQSATTWTIDVSPGEGAASAVHATSKGEPPTIGEIDPRAVGPTNELPKLTPERATAHTWKPDDATWEAIKKVAQGKDIVLTLTGHSGGPLRRVVSRGQVTLQVSTDPVGAPVVYRDVPLMPSAGERGLIKPLDPKLVPLIAWRLRDLSKPDSHVLMTGLHSCTNCHSYSRDGKTMGLDLDGPKNNKGLYALLSVQPQAKITRANVIQWSTFRGKLGGKLRVAFMSQVSPDGQHIVTTIADPGRPKTEYQRRQNPTDFVANYYVANFKDYRFLQVFYPTRGILAWYSKDTGMLEPLPGADDPRYVQTGATWSPDGKFLVFSRAEAKPAYAPDYVAAKRPNDPNETQIKYDLYRIPFNDGKGGKAVPIAGASANGMSNSFPKVSPDGRWVVFVEAKNGQLMRPDGKLYIVPVEGGEARQLRANTPLMNSWHSFSPNGRWLAFSSKSRTPYTQMFLTHLDEKGNSTPAILVENSTAANRAVNLPEFVNVPPGGFQHIDVPVAEYYKLIDDASEAMNQGRTAEALPLLQEALARDPDDPIVHNSYGCALAASQRGPEAIEQFRVASRLSPDYPDAHSNLASALVESGRPGAAVPEFRKALELKPDYPEAQVGLGGALTLTGKASEAIPILQEATERVPKSIDAQRNLSVALLMSGRAQDAIPHAQEAVTLSGGSNPRILDLLGRVYAQTGQHVEAIATTKRAIEVARQTGDMMLANDLHTRLTSYETAAGKAR